MKRFSLIFLGMLVYSGMAFAHHEGDFAVTLDDCNSLVVTPALRGGELDEYGFASEPGFDSEPGTLPAGQSVGFILTAALARWTGAGFEPLAAATEETLTLSLLVGGQILTATTADGPVVGFDSPIAADGSWHKHFGFTLNGSGGSPPRDGIYLLEMVLTCTAAGINASNNIYLVFGFNAEEADHEAAIVWGQYYLVDLPDMDDDGRVTLIEFSVLANQWLTSGCSCHNDHCHGADLTGDGTVDMDDLAYMVAYWLKNQP
ncbi:MAG: hypothetical protein JW709_02300 [Sedimentisphaerales bacterium]|nr:hypothetical protein [Sedimentisphaerales bacterium]